MDKIEKLAKQIFAEMQKEGEELTFEDAIEMAKMELGAKEIKNYVSSVDKTQKKPSKPRTTKVSDEKKELFSEIFKNLYDVYRENTTILNENKLIQVKIGEKTFKIDIIEQRAKKS